MIFIFDLLEWAAVTLLGEIDLETDAAFLFELRWVWIIDVEEITFRFGAGTIAFGGVGAGHGGKFLVGSF